MESDVISDSCVTASGTLRPVVMLKMSRRRGAPPGVKGPGNDGVALLSDREVDISELSLLGVERGSGVDVSRSLARGGLRGTR